MPKFLSNKELSEKYAGGDHFIRTKAGQVKVLAIRPDWNPRAPEIIVVGAGPRRERNTELLLNSGNAVPTYIKRDTDKWEYVGDYQATAYRTDTKTIEAHRDNRPRNEVAGILFMKATDKIAVEVYGGGFSDPQTRKEVEALAIKFVTNYFKSEGYKIEDCQNKNCGYDLLAISENRTLMIEVKGTMASEPRFFITRNERASLVDSKWRLALVTSARSNPQLTVLNAKETERQFAFDALAWECKPRRS